MATTITAHLDSATAIALTTAISTTLAHQALTTEASEAAIAATMVASVVAIAATAEASVAAMYSVATAVHSATTVVHSEAVLPIAAHPTAGSPLAPQHLATVRLALAVSEEAQATAVMVVVSVAEVLHAATAEALVVTDKQQIHAIKI